MAGNPADAITGSGILFCLLTAPVTGGASLLGIPALLGARAVRASLDKQRETGRNTMFDLAPYNHGSYYPPLVSRYEPVIENPLTVLARSYPRMAHDVFIQRSLDEIHASIVAGPATEFARQGRGMTAITKQRRGLFSRSVTTVIKPIG